MHQRSSKPRSFIALAAVIGLTPATAPAGQDELAIDTAMAGPVLKFDWPQLLSVRPVTRPAQPPRSRSQLTAANCRRRYGGSAFSIWQATQQQLSALVPMSDTDFYDNGRYKTSLSFTVDDGGKVKSVNPGRSQQVGTRID
jgi:hypothetical protein